MAKNGSLTWILLVAGMANMIACGDEDHSGDPNGSPNGPQPETRPFVNDPVWPNVWTINAFDGPSYEFKSNCTNVESDELETCFLWTVTAVIVEAPDGRRFELDKDFCINSYSGEITRRFVLYGPPDDGLPVAGEYRFLYYEGEEIVLTQIVDYVPETIGFPTDVTWRREGDDLVAEWTPPEGTRPDMWYKVLLFPFGGNVISNVFEWDASSARLPNIPLKDGAEGTLNVAIYFQDGFSPSEYLPFTW